MRDKLEHLEKDLEDGVIDLFTMNTALFYRGYIVLLRKELPPDADTWLAEVTDKTRLKLTKDMITK